MGETSLYQEESVLLPPQKSDSNITVWGVLRHGIDLKAAGEQMTESAKEAVQSQIAPLLDWVKKELHVDMGASDVALIQNQLRYNKDGVERLKSQYAKHNDAFNTMSDEEFLTRVVAKDHDRVKPGSSAYDITQILNDRYNASVEHEKSIMKERIDAVDGVNYGQSWMWPMSNGHLKYNEIRDLSDDKHKGLIDEFNKMFQNEIDKATQLMGDPNKGRWAVLDAVRQVHDEEQKSGKINKGDNFHTKVMDLIQGNIRTQETARQTEEKRELDAVGIDLSVPGQRSALALSTVAMGHNDIGAVPQETLQNSPFSKQMIKYFGDDFKQEIQQYGGAATVLAAVGKVYQSPTGMNNGQKNMTPDQFRQAVDTELANEKALADKQQTLSSLGVDFSNDERRKAFALAMNIQHPDKRPIPELVLKNTSIDNQIAAANAFHRDYADEITMAGNDVGKVLDAVGKIDPSTVKDGDEFRRALRRELGDKSAEPGRTRQRSENEPGVNGTGHVKTAAQKYLAQEEAHENSLLTDPDRHKALVAGAMLLEEMKLSKENPNDSVEDIKSKLQQYRQQEEAKSNEALDKEVKAKLTPKTAALTKESNQSIA